MYQHTYSMLSGPQQIICDSADFDGTNDYLTRGAGLTGAADSKQGIISFWVRLDGADGNSFVIFSLSDALAGTGNLFRVLRVGVGDIFQIYGANATPSSILNISTSGIYTQGSTWLNVLASWDLGAGESHLYVNDISDKTVTTLTDDSLDYTSADAAVGAYPDGNGKLGGCLAELYFAPGQYLDFSSIFNRRKFISSSGRPVYLGANGALPTGTAPIVYQRIADGSAASTFATNLGTGGDFTITGTLTIGSTSPSD